MAAENEFDIAIIGMSCRFPGAANVEQFWRNLAAGVESIARLTDEEILASGVPRAYLANPSYVKAAPVLDGPGQFDAAFFGFSPMEARSMDPQQRILLELAWAGLEDAGYDTGRYAGRVGVFTASAMNTYFMNSGLNKRFTEDYIPTLIGNDKDFLSTRISYKLDLKGPSLTVQTACSSSLVAVHLARQSLLSQETDMALAGAISIRVPHRVGYFYDGGGVVSPDGHVRAFDAKANGTVFGSGGGILVLKRLADAIADGDTIHAVIKGSAVNNDGAQKAGFTAPSVNSQADAVVEALANAGVEADSISYIEAHGSGTPVGDPIEVMALTKAFRTSTQRSGFCAIGSAKTNIGHIDAAAGIAGVIKSVLALGHRQLPPSLHFHEANPEIDFPSTPFYVNTRLQEWSSDGPRRAGVMATGMGGTNAHVVLEEAPARDSAAATGSSHLLILSAKTEAALDEVTQRLRGFLAGNERVNMGNVAYTLQVGRKAFAYRRCLVVADREDAVAVLGQADAKRGFSAKADEARRPVVLLLPGVGDQYVGMAHGLYEAWPVFRGEVERCAKLLEPHLGIDIRAIIYPDNRSWRKKGSGKGIDLKQMLGKRGDAPADPDAAALNRTLHAQPALFTIEYAIARLWQSLGIMPDAIVGHSMGEYVAACLAGVLSLEDALRLVAVRARLVEELPQGAMLAVMLSEDDLRPMLGERLSISLINGPSLCVVAGPVADMGEFERALAARSVICRRVQNAHAFHSSMLDPIAQQFQAEVSKIRLSPPKIRYLSNVSGTWITPHEATDPAYWAMHANHTARFSDALREVWRLENPILLEAGPGRTLGVLAMQHPDRSRAAEPVTIASVRHHYENEPDTDVLLQGIGKLWLAGAAIKWECLPQGGRPSRISLPTYPFERQDYWLENHDFPSKAQPPAGRVGPGRLAIDEWFHVPTWVRTPFAGDVKSAYLVGGSTWLIFADRWGGGTAFQKRLGELGATVHVARFGDTFRRRSDGSLEVNPDGPGDYLKLFREIGGSVGDALNIVHLGCLTADAGPADIAARRRNQDFGFFSLLHIAQAIGELGISIPIRIGAISNRIHEVTGEESLDPDMATVLGAAGVIPREFPNIACLSVDLPGPRVDDDPPADVVNRLLSEFALCNSGDVIAYRGTHRWQRKYERVNLSAPIPGSEGDGPPISRRLRHRGVYLITGGTGGLGLAFAKYLARTCAARLVLTKKAAFPEKAQWKELSNSKDTPVAVVRTLRELLDIERLGAEVEVVAAEVSDRDQMREVIDELLRRFGALNGVIHAAGIVRPELILASRKEQAQSVLRPKVEGTMVLSELLQNVNADFLVLFSSMASLTTPRGLADYSAANCFLDAFAGYANSRTRTHTLVINWPGWKEVGMLADLEVLPYAGRQKEVELEKAILTSDGLDAFARALGSDLKQVIVSAEDPADAVRQAGRAGDRARGIGGGRDSTAAVPLDGGRGMAVDPPRDEVETAVARIWTDVLGLERIGVHQQFSALGGHSLIAMQIVARIRAGYQVDFSLREFLEGPTIAQLSSRIGAKILREIESLSDEEARRRAQTT